MPAQKARLQQAQAEAADKAEQLEQDKAEKDGAAAAPAALASTNAVAAAVDAAAPSAKTCAQVLVDCLKAEGVEYVFGIPGEENLDLMFALKGSGIRFIPTRHEQGAAFMADVYGRLTGHAGVCLATLGPGATNLVTGVADAFLDGAPLVAITGQVSSELMQLTSHQYLDLSAMFAPITKRSKVVMRPTPWQRSVVWPSSTPRPRSPAPPTSTCPRTWRTCPARLAPCVASSRPRSTPTPRASSRRRVSSPSPEIRCSWWVPAPCAPTRPRP